MFPDSALGPPFCRPSPLTIPRGTFCFPTRRLVCLSDSARTSVSGSLTAHAAPTPRLVGLASRLCAPVVAKESRNSDYPGPPSFSAFPRSSHSRIAACRHPSVFTSAGAGHNLYAVAPLPDRVLSRCLFVKRCPSSGQPASRDTLDDCSLLLATPRQLEDEQSPFHTRRYQGTYLTARPGGTALASF